MNKEEAMRLFLKYSIKYGTMHMYKVIIKYFLILTCCSLFWKVQEMVENWIDQNRNRVEDYDIHQLD